MRKIPLLALLMIFAVSSGVYAQNTSIRLGASSASFNSRTPENLNTSVALGTDGAFYHVETRLDFNRNSAYWNIVQLEVGPSFLRAGPGLVFGTPNENTDQLRVDFGVTFKPWRGLYLNSRWAPVSINNRTLNHNNFLDASLGWQFKF